MSKSRMLCSQCIQSVLVSWCRCVTGANDPDCSSKVACLRFIIIITSWFLNLQRKCMYRDRFIRFAGLTDVIKTQTDRQTDRQTDQGTLD